MSRMIESLEGRQLFHSPFSASINFEPISAARAPGMLTDYGGTYAVRRGGLQYGWSDDLQAYAVDRNLTKLQKNDTFISMQNEVASDNSGQTTKVNSDWNIAVENGLYQVYIVAGDPGTTGDRMAITAEGQVAVSGVTKSARHYIEGLVTVNVTDNLLTIGSAAWAVNNKIDYIGIVSTEEAAGNTLQIDTPANTTTEGQTAGKFRITRAGDLTKAVTVSLTISGTATNGVDYGKFGTQVTFAAGIDSIDLPVRAVADNVTEGNETVTLTLGAVTGYTNVTSSATVTISDPSSSNPSNPAPTNITWATKAARPVKASEIMAAGVGNKLYTFGGFVDSTYKPTKAAYAYDVTTNTWTTLASLPIGLTHAGIAEDGRYIYFAGGYPGSGTGGAQVFSTTSVFRYDTQTNTYSNLPSLPALRGAGSLGLLGGKLYFVSGQNSSRADVTDVWALDLSNTAAGWVARAPLPAARNHAGTLGLNGKLYVIAGQTDRDANTVTHNSSYSYNPNTNTWTTLASIPTARSHMADSTFIYDNKIVVLGGQSGFNVPITSDVIYDPTTNTWSALNSLPASRFSGGGAYVGGKFVYTAGYQGTFENTTYVGTLS